MTWTAKRFYRDCSVLGEEDGFVIALDGRQVRTPAKARLLLPNPALADAVAAEWRAQTEVIDPQTMPYTRLASTAIDRIATRREEVIDEIAAYAESDLLCHHAEAPADLAARQLSVWQPLLDWLAERHGASLAATVGIVPLRQPQTALDAVRDAVAAFDDMAMAGLHLATTALGSVVLALALADRRLEAEEAFAASTLDETYQMETWGEDAEAAARRAAVRADVLAAAAFLSLCRA